MHFGGAGGGGNEEIVVGAGRETMSGAGAGRSSTGAA
jgi:hypothetical protein